MWISFMGNKHDVLRVCGSSYHGHGGLTPPPPPPQLNETHDSYTRREFLSCVANKMQCLVITLMNALCNRDYRGWNGVDFQECLVKEISTVRGTSWMAIYLTSCDSILVSYNDVLGKPMVSFGLVMCCGWGVKILWGGQNTIIVYWPPGGHFTTGSKYYTTPALCEGIPPVTGGFPS